MGLRQSVNRRYSLVDQLSFAKYEKGKLPATAGHNNAFNHEFCRPGKKVKCVKEFVFEMFSQWAVKIRLTQRYMGTRMKRYPQQPFSDTRKRGHAWRGATVLRGGNLGWSCFASGLSRRRLVLCGGIGLLLTGQKTDRPIES
jgi:hypothetical protein